MIATILSGVTGNCYHNMYMYFKLLFLLHTVLAAPALCDKGQVANTTNSCSDEIKIIQSCRDGRDGLPGSPELLTEMG